VFVSSDLLNGLHFRFQWYLTEGVLQTFKSIPRSHLEHASRPETVTRIVERYGEDKAVEITIQILREIGNNNEAEKLMKAHSENIAEQQILINS
uniref:Pyrin domain-containing protein n=1 Tax=Oryzias sinensis TaxID=183150 RepID=A0A8C7ZYW5_9TELE